IGIRDSRPPVAELSKQRAGLGFVALASTRGGPVDGARVPVVAAHPPSGIVFLPLFGDGVLRFEGEEIVVAARLAVQEIADARKMTECVAELRQGIGCAHPRS